MADRVSTEAKRDRDRRRRGFSCKRGRIAQGSDSCNATADEVTHERRQAIVLAAEPMVLNDSVLAFNVAGFTEAFRERCRMASGAIERSTTDKADHRQLLRLLRARRERPPSNRAAERGQQFPPSDGDFHTPLPCEVRKGKNTTTRHAVPNSRGSRRGWGERRAPASTDPRLGQAKPVTPIWQL